MINKFLKPNRLVYLFVIVNIFLGGFVVVDFGKSWDEDRFFEYGDTSAQFYSDINYAFTAPEGIFGRANHQYYGPFYILAANLYVDKFDSSNTQWDQSNYYHFFYFITFQIGVIVFYYLCTHFMSEWASFATTLLFGTQPLLVGHAFINPKDLPFMVFFMTSIYFGVRMVEHFPTQTPGKVNSPDPRTASNTDTILLQDVVKEVKPYFTFQQKEFKLFWIIWLCAAVGFILSRFFLGTAVKHLISNLYNADPSSFLGSIFSKLAEDTHQVPLEVYQTKGSTLLGSITLILFWLSILFFPLIIYPLLKKLKHIVDFDTSVIINLGKRVYRGSRNLFVGINKNFFKEIAKNFTHRTVLLAGIFFGITASLRIIGPAAGGIILIYFLLKFKQRSIPPLISYSLIGMISAYLTWPFLWRSPINRYFTAVRLMMNYPWDNNLLFRGEIFPANGLPATYLPSLISIQLTESAILLAILGIGLIWYQIMNKYDHKYLIIMLWFFPLVLYTMLFKPTMYDNFRQFLFLLPPLFIFAGIAIDSIKVSFFKWSKVIIFLLVIILVLPGIFGIINLHPYQYIYYNSFVGGVEGAFRHYELDYWATSHKESMEYINQNVEKNAKIIVWGGPVWLAEGYAREDLTITHIKNLTSDEWTTYDYEIILTRGNIDLRHKDRVMGPTIYQVTRDNGILSKVVQIEK